MTGRIFLVFLLFGIVQFKAEADLSPEERGALVALRHAVGGRPQLWNMSENPCSWNGVTCSKSQDTILELRLPGMGLSGQLPSGLGALKNLQTLSLRFNALTGSIPSDISNLNGTLRNLFLRSNFLSGPIPPFLFGMKSMVKLSLANNNFSGGISKDIRKLPKLQTLYLEGNQLTGSMPKSDSLSQIAQFNVSHNKLTGRIPKWATKFPASSFEGNALCGGALTACKKKKLSAGAIAGIVIGCVIGLLLILLLLTLFLLKRRNSRKTGADSYEEKNVKAEMGIHRKEPLPVGDTASKGSVIDSSALSSVAKVDGKSSNVQSLVFFSKVGKIFDLEDLLRASAEVLGKGTFGTTYKASIDVGVVVAVKRLKDVTATEEEFRARMAAIGNMNHENLVPLRAYYHSRDEKLLVYDYLQMGSLSALLHGNRGAGRTPLNWESRSRIAIGAARAIEYIHSQGATTSHGNIKSSNILLTTIYEARVSDFGLAQLAQPSPTPNRVDGYRAPEVTDTRKVSQKADVYSFGVCLLELLTGKPPTHSINNDDGVDLPRWVQSVVREEWAAEVFDLELLRYQSVEEDMVHLLQLAVDCTAQYPDSRPRIGEVRSRIEAICGPSLQQDLSDDITDDTRSQQEQSVDSSAPTS